MKNITRSSLLFLVLLILNCGCSKSDTTTAGSGGGGSSASTDPAVLILGKWQLIQDNIVTNNFAFSNGDVPIPGTYNGTASDYWLFQTNGTVVIYEGGYVGTPAYQLPAGNRLLIPAMQWGDITITTLTATSFIWEKSMTSTSGGTYYRKATFRK